MLRSWKSGVLFLSVALVTLVSFPKQVAVADEQLTPSTTDKNTNTPTYSLEIDKWISVLAQCESNNNELAVNPKDVDGTPSIGRFQFKFGTFKAYVKKYNLFDWKVFVQQDWINALYNGAKQEVVLRKMLQDKDVNFRHEFPTCVREHGMPPAIS